MFGKKILPVIAFGIAALVASSANAQSTTSGAISGVVTDKATGQPMLLVTVVATSPALQSGGGQVSEFTDASGQYFISNLPPGRYSLLFVYGEAKTRRENIDIFIGKTITANAQIDTSQTATVVIVKEKAPTIDRDSTKQGLNLGTDYTKNVPTRGRTYEGAIGAAPGAQGDLYGVSFSGSSSLENSYVVDGINTTGLTFGTVGSPLLNNFIQEIEVITGGYNAEFGRSTGGVVNVVTKTGSNEFHGSVWANVAPFEATRERVFNAGSALSSAFELGTELDFGFDLGGPIVKDKVWFYVGFAPVINQTKVQRIASTQVDRMRNTHDYSRDADPDDNPNTTTNVGCETHPTTSSDGCEGDGRPDLDPETGFTKFEEVHRREYESGPTLFQVTSKINFAANPNNQGQVSFTGNFSGGTSYFSPNGTPTATQEDFTQTTTDVSGKWTSKLLNNKLQVDVVGGWHHDNFQGESVNEELPGRPGQATRETPRERYINIGQGFINLGTLGHNPDVAEDEDVFEYCTDHYIDPARVGTVIADPFTSIENCPTAQYSMMGLGGLDDTKEDRYTGKLTGTYRLKAAGHHQFKAGADFEDNRLADNRLISGGKVYDSFDDWEIFQWVRYTNDATQWTRPAGHPQEGTMYDVCRRDIGTDNNGDGVIDPAAGESTFPDFVTDIAVPCDYLDGTSENDPENDPILASRGRTFNWSVFLQDNWQILPNLTLNAGFRYEQQVLKNGKNVLGTVDPATGIEVSEDAMALTNLYAPRVGLIYDWTKEGRSKVYAHWGRFYESIPMDINNRSFGGETSYETYWDWYADCGAEATGPDDPITPGAGRPQACPQQPAMDGTPPTFGDVALGTGSPQTAIPAGVTLIVPGIQPQYLDEFVVGAEYEVLEDLRVGLTGQYRRLGAVIEDVSTDGATTYIIANPGSFPASEETKLQNEIDGMAAGPVRDALQARLDMFRGVRNFDKPTRDYYAIGLTGVKRFSRAFMVQGSYTFSKLSGNYPGLFSPDTGQLDPNITSQYDLIELLANREGPLPHDRPHNFKLDGYYTFDLQKAGRVTTGARLRAQSGVPIDVLGRHNAYGRRESYILPRGANGRTDFLATADLHVAYGRKIGQMDLEVYFELFNVFNTQTEGSKDEEYTVDRVNPIIGGDFGDIPYLKRQNPGGVETGELARKNRNYGNTTGRLAPLTGRFGLTLTF